jgi:hypothetical protein
MINPEINASIFLNQTDPAGQGSANPDTIEELKKFPGLSISMRPSAAVVSNLRSQCSAIRSWRACGRSVPLWHSFFSDKS